MKPASIVAVAVLIWCMAGIAPEQSHAFHWKVRMPKDVPYARCTINMFAGGYYKQVILQTGESTTWEAPNNTPLTDISGWGTDILGNVSPRFMNRTCAGADYDLSAFAVKCSYDVSVKVCLKPTGYGFCPD